MEGIQSIPDRNDHEEAGKNVEECLETARDMDLCADEHLMFARVPLDFDELIWRDTGEKYVGPKKKTPGATKVCNTLR